MLSRHPPPTTNVNGYNRREDTAVRVACLWVFCGAAAGQEPVHPGRQVPEIGGVPGGHFGRDVTGVADGGQGPPDVQPVDVSVAQVLPGESPVWTVELEVLQVDLDDARAERANP